MTPAGVRAEQRALLRRVKKLVAAQDAREAQEREDALAHIPDAVVVEDAETDQ